MNDQQRAAMQMALEALNAMLTHMGMDEDDWNKLTFDQAREAITALREALAQSTNSCQNSTKLVETQPQGGWVDLTDDEVNEIVHEKVMDMRMTYKDLVRAVIAAFKEKNK